MNKKSNIDIRLLGPVLVLIVISLTTIFSINSTFFKSQLISLVVGLIAYFFFSKINVDFLRQLKLPLYLISLALFLIILFIGIETRGAVRWVDIFGIRLQFSEIMKPFLALAFAANISDRQDADLKSFITNILLIVPVFLLIFFQPDLGTALLYAGAAVFALLVYGFPIVWFMLIMVPFILFSPFLWLLLHDYQRQRVLTFLNSGSDPLGSSYNSIQAIIAVGSGAILGKGISEGSQSVLKFLPERHTDFIFATISEGLGFIGASLVIAAFLLLLYRLYALYRKSDQDFEKVFISLTFGLFFIQGFVNIAMNIGILPIVGVTLPFVSFGGSSLLSNFIFLGMITSLTSHKKDNTVLEIR